MQLKFQNIHQNLNIAKCYFPGNSLAGFTTSLRLYLETSRLSHKTVAQNILPSNSWQLLHDVIESMCCLFMVTSQNNRRCFRRNWIPIQILPIWIGFWRCNCTHKWWWKHWRNYDRHCFSIFRWEPWSFICMFWNYYYLKKFMSEIRFWAKN